MDYQNYTHRGSHPTDVEMIIIAMMRLGKKYLKLSSITQEWLKIRHQYHPESQDLKVPQSTVSHDLQKYSSTTETYRKYNFGGPVYFEGGDGSGIWSLKDGVWYDEQNERIMTSGAANQPTPKPLNHYLALFRQFFIDNYLPEAENDTSCLAMRHEFTTEYPLERLKILSLQDYALGGESSKESFCYKLEYGKYEDAGLRIGGANAAKFGIYYKDGEYHGAGKEVFTHPESFWQKYRQALYDFLIEYGKSDEAMSARDKYQILVGSAGRNMYLTKLLFLYYPEKFVNYGAGIMQDLFRAFGYSYLKNAQAETLSFILNQNLRRDIPELSEGDPEYIGRALYDFASRHFHDTSSAEPDSQDSDDGAYTKADFLREVFISSKDYETLKQLLDIKRNLILEGAPGVGKTFMAKRLAYSIMGAPNDGNILFLQFHQSYSYEDFIEGFRPTEDGKFCLHDGVFKSFCKRAAEHPDEKFYCIVDEINRGNLSKIFGELMFLIESDKRGKCVTLPYSGAEFSIPRNLYFIGMMNTADRSLAMVDYALRRRFGFYFVEPAFETDESAEKFKNYLVHHDHVSESNANKLVKTFRALNSQIKSDLGKGFKIGHSYFVDRFTNQDYAKTYATILDYEILPLIEEYWPDQSSKVTEYQTILSENA